MAGWIDSRHRQTGPFNLTGSVAGVVIGWALVSLSGLGVAGEPDKKLNLLILHTDEHNFRTLGCYRRTLSPEQAFMWGEAVVETPHIDWLASHGALCTSFYATTPVCSPSRAAFLSGLYPQHTPVVTNNVPLGDGIVTFAELLRRTGYATGYAGKWHLDGTGKPQWAPARRFGFEDNRYMFNRGHWKQLEDTPDGPRVAARSPKGAPDYSVRGATPKNFTTDFLADRAVEFIGRHSDQFFCYMVSFPDPHGPDTVRAPYDSMFDQQSYTKPRTYEAQLNNAPSWGQPSKSGYGMASYYGMVKCIDDNVGKLLAALREAEILDRTIVVFTADHGDLRGEHHRQNKGVPYEGSACVPMIIYCPSQIAQGTQINQALSSVDFFPTILSLMSCPTSGQEQGRDASALFRQRRAPSEWTDVAFLRSTSSGRPWLAAVSDRYKFVLSAGDAPWLFDLEEDPDELQNFALQPTHRQHVRELATQLAAYARQCKDPYLEQTRIRADLNWALSDLTEYRSPPAPASPAKPARGKRKRLGG